MATGNNDGSKSTHQRSQLPFVTIRHHSLNPMNIRAEATQFHLLALTRLYSQRIRIYPLIRRDVSRFMGICEDVEHGRLVDDGQKCHG